MRRRVQEVARSRAKWVLHTGKMKRACLRRILQWRGRSSSAFLEANGGASAGGTALYPRRASAELPRRLAALAASSCVLARAHAAAALDREPVILIKSLL